jgi:hypothetical protein
MLGLLGSAGYCSGESHHLVAALVSSIRSKIILLDSLIWFGLPRLFIVLECSLSEQLEFATASSGTIVDLFAGVVLDRRGVQHLG